jgi:hypothetical protein
MFFSKDNKSVLLIVIILGFISLIFAAYSGEDALGGARYDYLFHEKYIMSFSENFNHAINDFGGNYEVRNSPVFFIYSSYFLKFGIDIKYFKYFNLVFLIPLIIFFLKSLDLKYEKLNIYTKCFLLTIIFISPTIRSLSAWPYPLTWAICFFLISIFYFLKFQKNKVKSKKIKYSILNISFLALSAYFTPNFGIFSIFYFFYFFKYFKLTKYSFLMIFINIALSLPAIYFLISKDFYLFRHEANHVISNYTIYDTLNISNKIIIISSIFFFFFIPLIELKKTKIKLESFTFVHLILLLFFLINIFFFNFSKGLGGGLFYHLSIMLFDGPNLLFFIFGISLFIFSKYGLFNSQNIFLFIILLIYNIQSTIYYKYYDPIIFFMILFLIKLNFNLDINKISKKYFFFYLFFLAISYGKALVTY